MIIFEFFSGVGGMHQAVSEIEAIKINNIIPFDINPNANITYLHNFNIKPIALSLENFSIKDYEKICEENKADNNIIWLMSPPCQPFTRLGNNKDLDDDRTNGFKNLISILKETKYLPEFLLLENVKNFEYSDANALIVSTLKEKKFFINQFLLSPNQLGIPNSRLRYYLLARNSNQKPFPMSDEEFIIDNPNLLRDLGLIKNIDPPLIKELISFDNDYSNFYLKQELLNKESSVVMDLVTYESNNTNCFTKAYSRLLKGTGSLLLTDISLYNKEVNIKCLYGKLRFFTPTEIMRFMCFNKSFNFPKDIKLKAQYKLLGNSINVKVVNYLLKYLFFY